MTTAAMERILTPRSIPLRDMGTSARERPALETDMFSASLFLTLGFLTFSTSTDEALSGRASIIKPAATELKWQQIPWVTDLTHGLKLAREETRPIFLWVTGDDPLERC